MTVFCATRNPKDVHDHFTNTTYDVGDTYDLYANGVKVLEGSTVGALAEYLAANMADEDTYTEGVGGLAMTGKEFHHWFLTGEIPISIVQVTLDDA